MYQDGNYSGCIDQLSQALASGLTPAEQEEADYYLALSAVETGQDNALEQLENFLAEHPASKRRTEVKMSIADQYFFNGEYALALSRYQEVEKECLSGDKEEDYRYRLAYCRLRLADYDEALAGFKTLEQSKRYGNAARFYKAYIAYAGEDYRKAAILFKDVDRNVAPGNMADYYLAQIYFMNEEYEKAKKTAISL